MQLITLDVYILSVLTGVLIGCILGMAIYLTINKKSEGKSNYNRIRNMSVEELAIEHIYFVPDNKDFHYTGLSGEYTKTAEETIKNNIEWLESEVTE